MNRRQCLALLAAAPLAAAVGPRRGYTDADYARAIVIDGLGGPGDPDGKPGVRRMSARGASELKQSGMTAVRITVGEVGNAPDAFEKAVASFAWIGNLVDANPDLYVIARRAADIRTAKAAGRTALVLGTQDTSAIGADLDRLALLKGLGLRNVQLTYNLRNLSGDGSLEKDDAGLSKLGRETIERIEAEQLLLDLSHGGARTIAEAAAAATRPLTISHTGCRALHDNPRNVGDASMKLVADKGGVVGIYWMPFLVAGGKPTTADLVRHMTHAVNICGEDHVGIGTDGGLHALVIDDERRARQKQFYETRAAKGIAAPGEAADVFNYVADLNSHMRFRMLAQALSDAGWPGARIDKILGANVLRVYGEAWGA